MVAFCPEWQISLIYGHPMIGVLIFPDFQILDAAGPISVFDIAGRYAKSRVPIRVMSAKPGPVRSSSGVEMLAQKFGLPSAITTLIIAGGDGVEAAARNTCTLQFVRAVASRGAQFDDGDASHNASSKNAFSATEGR